MTKNSKSLTNMKREASTMAGRSFKKTKRAVTTFENIPRELLGEILGRVASDSFTDMFNAKLSCKEFHEIVEDRYIYQRVSLDNFPIVAWTPLNEKQLDFLAKCEECDNPELIFRQVAVDYFSGKGRKSAVNRLDRALKLEHPAVLYLSCILLLFSDDDELKEQGAKWLCRLRKCKKLRRKFSVYRDKLTEILRMIWVEDSIFEHRPFCCTKRDDHKVKTSWPGIDEEEALHCEACSIDNEIRLISKCF